MHEKFRHFIEDFQMKGCPAPPDLELLGFGCTQSSSPGRAAPGHVCVPCCLLACSLALQLGSWRYRMQDEDGSSYSQCIY